MGAQLTVGELAELIERLQHFNGMPPEQRTTLLGRVARQRCVDEKVDQLFDAFGKGKPTESEYTQFCEHVGQCTSCGEFLRDVWLATGRDGY